MTVRCEHFCIQELVPPSVYADRGDRAWQLLDWRMLWTLDRLRKRYGKMTINNWHWGGERMWSCLRTEGSPFGTEYSQHRFGRAADCIFADVTAEQVRQDVLDNPDDEDFKYITSIELGVDWFHFDVRNCNRIMTYYP